MNHLPDYFTILKFDVRISGRGDVQKGGSQWTTTNQATIKVKIHGNVRHEVSEGDGPLNALDAALRKALEPSFPFLSNVRIIDFSVAEKNLETKFKSDGSEVPVTVSITFEDNVGIFTLKRTSTDIVNASFKALVNGFRKTISRNENKKA